MFELIKKTLLVGLGASVVTKEKVDNLLQGFVEQGKLSKEEAKKMANDVVNESKEEFQKASTCMQNSFKDLLNKASLVNKEQFQALEERVKALEEARDN